MSAAAQPNPGDAGVTGSSVAPAVEYEVIAPNGARGSSSHAELSTLPSGYKPTGRVRMYAPDGTRGWADPQAMANLARAGYTTTPKTQFERQGESGFAARHPAMTRFGLSAAAAAGIPETAHPLSSLRQNLDAAGSQIEHPVRTLGHAADSFWQQHKSDVGTAENRFRRPGLWNKIIGAEEYLESGVPMWGPNVIHSQEQLEHGDVAGGLGTAGGTVAPFLAPEGARFARENAPAAAARTAELAKAPVRLTRWAAQETGLATPEPVAGMTRALKPSNTRANFAEAMQSAGPDLQRYARNAGKPITGLTNDELTDAAVGAKRQLWRRYAGNHLGPAGEMGAVVDGNEIADAMEATVTPRMRAKHAAQARAISDYADTLRRPIPVDEAEQILGGANKELNAYYAKNKVGREVAKADPDTAGTVAEADAMRDALYRKLDEVSGPGAADLKRRYGALTQVQDAALRRKPVAQRISQVGTMSALGRLGAAGKLVGGILKADPEKIAEGVYQRALGQRLSNLNNSDWLVNQAFNGPHAFEPSAELESPPPRNPILSAVENQRPGLPPPRTPIRADAPSGPPLLPPHYEEMPGVAAGDRANLHNLNRRLPAVGETSPTRTALGALTTPPLALPPMRGIFAPGGNPMAGLGEPVPHYAPPAEPEPPQRMRSARGILRNSGGTNLDRVLRSRGAAPSADDLKLQIAKLKDQQARNNAALRNVRLGTQSSRELIQRAKQVSRQIEALEAQIGYKEPQATKPEAKEPVLEGRRIGGGGYSYTPPKPREVTAPETESRATESATPTYDALPQEMREAVDAEAKALPHMPQALREGRMKEIARLGPKGAPLKERLAIAHAAEKFRSEI